MKRSFFRTPKGTLMFPSKSSRDKYSECSRKEALTNAAANQIIKKVARKDHKLLYTYLCPHCKMWHLTHIKS